MSPRVKAAILYELNAPLRIESGIELPALAGGQILVKLAYSGVCHSQLMEARGARGVDRFLPHMLGHEGTGLVVATGEQVSKVKPGQKVVLGWIKGRGNDVPGSRYRLGDQVINAGAVTTFSDYAVVSENRCVPLPADIPMDVGVLFGCALPTGAGIVTNTIKPVAGSTIAVFGLGGIGISALMACGFFECRQLIAVDVEPEKLSLARALGATEAIDSSKQDSVAEIRRLTGGLGVDYSIEAAGLARTIEMAFDSVRRGGGWCVFASHPKNGDKIAIDPYELICGKRITGTWGGSSNPDEDVPRFAQMYRSGRLPLEKLMTRRYALEEINVALADLEHRRVGRPLIEIDASLA